MRNIKIATFDLNQLSTVKSRVPSVLGCICFLDSYSVKGSLVSILGKNKINEFYRLMIEEIKEVMEVFKDPESQLECAKDTSYLMKIFKN
jgi:hypothetical protein